MTFTPWSKPYYGIRHRYCKERGIQLTVSELTHAKGKAVACWYDLHGIRPFTAIEERLFKTVAEAKRWLEVQFEEKDTCLRNEGRSRP